MKIDNDAANTCPRRFDGDGSLARAILSLNPWVVTLAYLILSLWPMFTLPGSPAYVTVCTVFAFALGGWWWAIVRMVMRARSPGRLRPWLLAIPLAWMPIQWLAERWLGPMDGDLSSPQVAFKFASMFVAVAFFYGFWRLASAFEQIVRGEKAKAEEVLATVFQLIFVLVGVWTLHGKIRRLLSLAA